MINQIAILTVFGIFFGIAFWSRKTTRMQMEGEPNTIKTLHLTGTLLATAIGGGLIYGIIQIGMDGGVVGAIFGIVYFLGFAMLGVLAPAIRKYCKIDETNKNAKGVILSFNHLLLARYGKNILAFVAIIYSLVYVAFLAAQYVALAKFISTYFMGLNIGYALFLSALCVVIYTSAGGYRAVVYSDLVQVVFVGLLVFYLIFIVFPMYSVGDVMKLPPKYFNGLGMGFPFLLWSTLFVIPTLVIRLDHWQRILTAKDWRVARKAYLFSGVFLLITFLCFTYLGMLATANGSKNLFYVFNNSFGRFTSWIPIVAIICAILSSADTVLNVNAVNVVQSLSVWFPKIQDNNKDMRVLEKVFLSRRSALRLSTIILGTFAYFWSLTKPDVVMLITEGFKYLLVFIPMIFGALLSENPSRTGVIASITMGIGSSILVQIFVNPNYGFVVGFIVAVLVFYSASKWGVR